MLKQPYLSQLTTESTKKAFLQDEDLQSFNDHKQEQKF